MRKNLLLALMILISIPAAALFFLSVHAFRAQENAMDSMMRSYVLDLADTFSPGISFSGRGQMQRHRPPGQARFRMLSMDPALKGGDAGGVLILGRDGRVIAGSHGAEKLLFLWKDAVPGEEPRKVRDDQGNDYYVVLRELEGDEDRGSFILAAVSRTVLLAPLTGIWRFWILTAMAASAAIFLGMILLWRYLAVPLRRIAETIRGLRWGKDHPPVLYGGPLYELESLSGAIGTLAEEAFAKEELKRQYVTDLVKIEEETRKHLARELHDGPLQSSVAAIKRIQLAKEALPPETGELHRHLDTAEEVVQTAAREIREYCDELSPSWIRLGLASSMQENADRLAGAYEGVSVDVEVGEDLDILSEESSLALVRIFQEAVSNSARHGRARSVRAILKKEGHVVHFTIEDDGGGFDAARISGTEYELLRTTGHRGLANMNERVRLLGGTMKLESSPGQGCRIDIVFPLCCATEDPDRNG
ncbi:signal transduction histidine kinase [Aminivibrio pyruvatiphilus]|uniref:Signal transduction histidine kinase n=1 Tax=Aminivibrio pyruvatiphilus TaxID=1005740 RepID=A0A4R8LYY9_9BACT|nr:ATP-binding protein [Aminivibrio pyruvatiphilus]TDY52600.1 signal transduction histidine kinase [Aminivibrio pyruvatiphilus]